MKQKETNLKGRTQNHGKKICPYVTIEDSQELD